MSLEGTLTAIASIIAAVFSVLVWRHQRESESPFIFNEGVNHGPQGSTVTFKLTNNGKTDLKIVEASTSVGTFVVSKDFDPQKGTDIRADSGSNVLAIGHDVAPGATWRYGFTLRHDCGPLPLSVRLVARGRFEADLQIEPPRQGPQALREWFADRLWKIG